MKTLRESTVYGNEITNTARITKMNMILAGDGHSNIKMLDSLANPIDGTETYMENGVLHTEDLTLSSQICRIHRKRNTEIYMISLTQMVIASVYSIA